MIWTRNLLIWTQFFNTKITNDPDVLWTRNLLSWNQTRYRCATDRFYRVMCFIKNYCAIKSQFLDKKLTFHRHDIWMHNLQLWNQTLFLAPRSCIPWRVKFKTILRQKIFFLYRKIPFDPDVIWTRNLLIWIQTRYRCATDRVLQSDVLN